jgi:hypothetical protein
VINIALRLPATRFAVVAGMMIKAPINSTPRYRSPSARVRQKFVNVRTYICGWRKESLRT